jgi:predicted ribosome-associated RNA-binding protein Tma20
MCQGRIYIKAGVESYLISGADLMWPGVKRVEFEEKGEVSFEGMPKKK